MENKGIQVDVNNNIKTSYPYIDSGVEDVQYVPASERLVYISSSSHAVLSSLDGKESKILAEKGTSVAVAEEYSSHFTVQTIEYSK